MKSFVKSVVPQPETEEELLSLIREVMARDDFYEVVVRKGEPLIVTSVDDLESDDNVHEITPWDIVRFHPLVELISYDGLETVEQVLRASLDQVSRVGKWPVCILVNDADLFLRKLGWTDQDILYRPRIVYGYQVIGDVRIEQNVLVIPATDNWLEGYGLITTGVLANYDIGDEG